jgi:peptide/nickel transport system substrate-binding protein
LAEAGFAGGFDIDLYAWRDRNQTEAIMGYLGAVGIRARMRFLQFPAVRAAVRSGRAPLTHSSLNAFLGDVSTTVSLFHNFSPDDVNRDPELRRLLQEGNSAMDPEARKAAYRKAFALIAERAYVLPLYSVPGYYVSARDLEFKPYADNILRFWEMSYR